MNLFLYPDGSSAEGTVSGIIDSSEQSVPNAVAALYIVDEKGHFLVATKETNENGFYLFPNLKSGEYLVKSKKQNDNKTDSAE